MAVLGHASIPSLIVVKKREKQTHGVELKTRGREKERTKRENVRSGAFGLKASDNSMVKVALTRRGCHGRLPRLRGGSDTEDSDNK